MQNSVLRGISAARKWEIFREFYDHRSVSLDLIAEMTGVRIESVRKLAEVEGWQELCGATQLRQKLAWQMSSCLDQLSAGEGYKAQRDVKSLQLMTATLETLARSEEKMARTKMNDLKGRDRNTDTDDEVALDADGMRTLDRELKQLIDKIESDRGTGASA